MLCVLNCVYTTWYEWHEITVNDMKYNPLELCMIWEMIWYEDWNMRNDMIWMRNDSGVIFNNVENGKILWPHALCVLMDTSIPSRGYKRVHY